jgi:hypothetical protein
MTLALLEELEATQSSSLNGAGFVFAEGMETMNNEIARDLLALFDLGLEITNPRAYKIVRATDNFARSPELAHRTQLAAANMSIGVRLFGLLQAFHNATEENKRPAT